ncbi:ABC transporter ATP-binding protein [Candidatus Accumulibacter vicinus]|uniref:ABC transporter ATP-binding protein n=1 Tax=Candidatus Accumulibacter vicinus TaxID=2954382 RepID=UPI00235B5E7E|nr:ABC transporter ATP-binding protein [Candidatus Accumulibacter vicinus]
MSSDLQDRQPPRRPSNQEHCDEGKGVPACADYAIRVDNLSKCYQVYEKPHDRLKQSICPWLQRLLGKPIKQYYREYWALKDVAFEVKRGETVGIIGRNGAGKSTLLQLVCGTLAPTTGTIKVKGRVAALLELGAGFNPEFTGRENVYMNASILGLSTRQIEARFEQIVAFADIGEFINQPVKTYSSGMYVRLAFAVIAHVDADVLIIDEALAVGDAFFTQKCMRFIRQYQESGGTILFVSHDMGAVTNICQSAVILFGGGQNKAITGPAETLCKQYLSQIYDDPTRHQAVVEQRMVQIPAPSRENDRAPQVLKGTAPEANIYSVSAYREDTEAFGVGGATIVNAGFFDEDEKRLVILTGGQPVCFVVRVRANQDISYLAVGLMLKDRLGQYLYTEGTDPTFRHLQPSLSARDTVDVRFRFTMPILIRGQYTMNIAVAEGRGDDHIQHHWAHDAMIIESISGPVVHGIGGFLNTDIAMNFLPQLQAVVP